MSLTFSQFKEELEKETPLKSYRGDCPLCGHPIVDQLREDDQFICVEGKHLLVHDDCYFHALGNELDQCAIFMPRALRAA